MGNPATSRHPELLLSIGDHEGYLWEVQNNGVGYRCGFVRVPRGHPWHGRGYDQIPADLNFAQPDTEDDAWWLGFGWFDAPDPSLPLREGRSPDYYDHLSRSGVIRTTEYVESECHRLAEQARRAERGL
ncbi:MAG TPA: hypothetical protein VF070_46290 [Streptosporangiaceae bacterium]